MNSEHSDAHGHRRRERRRDGSGRGRPPRPLSDCCEDTVHVIVENQDKQSKEMGLFSGARVQIISNDPDSANMVIGINESRYMLNKKTAGRILVR